jgi:hypothetical protein
VVQFIVGWSLIYGLGFHLYDVINKGLEMKEAAKMALFSFIIYTGVFFIYRFYAFDSALYLNKYPPSPLYLFLGLTITALCLVLFSLFEKHIEKRLLTFLSFFSTNSFWLFMWNALTISIIAPFLGAFGLPLFFRFPIEIILNILAVMGLVYVQKGFVDNLKRHHFY